MPADLEAIEARLSAATPEWATPSRATIELTALVDELRQARAGDRWWVCTDALARGGAKVIGPFESQELALDVRKFIEAVPQFTRDGIARQQATLWVDSDKEAPHG